MVLPVNPATAGEEADMPDATAVDPRETVAYRAGSVIEDMKTRVAALEGWYELRGLDNNSHEPRRLSYEQGAALDSLWYDTMADLRTQLERLEAILAGDEDPATSAG
jgi:hypothetical protein